MKRQTPKMETMKTLFLFIVVLLTIQITGICQSNQTVALNNFGDKSIPETSKTIYYFTKMEADSSIFTLDTLRLSKVEMDRDFPKFEFNRDSKFYFYYGFSLKKRKVRNLSTGELEERFAKTPKIIEGDWKSDDMQKDIQITLFNNSVVNYSIVDQGKFIYLIKQK